LHGFPLSGLTWRKLVPALARRFTCPDTGGWIALELALLERERVTHLLLTNTEIPGRAAIAGA
jgi:pimeloyl-ACP methyl ester carboxylesterase